MTYRVDINLSSKPRLRPKRFQIGSFLLGIVTVAGITSVLYFVSSDKQIDNRELQQTALELTALNNKATDQETLQQDTVLTDGLVLGNAPQVESVTDTTPLTDESSNDKTIVAKVTDQEIATAANTIEDNLLWREVEIKRGENLSILFDRLGISPTVLYNIMALGDDTAALKKVMPGQSIQFGFRDGQFSELLFEKNLTETLRVSKHDDSYSSETIVSELEVKTRYASASIDSSLFLAGQKVGITDKVIMNMVSIYGWDIDFALDIRTGDRFSILYEEHFKDGIKVKDGPVLAAEFTNQGRSYRAVRYTHADGKSDYYSDTGHNMRKAFMRTPVNYARISSHFNLRRKHPVLNTIRAHRGVDYAARTGTPIMATGDGTVVHKGNKGGYGRTVILKHGSEYTTLYAHMSKYARSVSRGKRVKQGQIIGYVGSSGLATGPHLHYEFRVNGAHRNPLKVKFPKAKKIADDIMDDFKLQTTPLLARLEQEKQTAIASMSQPDSNEDIRLAMRDKDNIEFSQP